jgi:hypothetical protein
MSAALPRKDWKEQAGQLLRQITMSRLDTPTMFPGKEHIQGKASPLPPLRDNLNKFFSKTIDSLVSIEPLSNMIKLAPNDIIQEKDKVYKELKRLKEKAIFAQLQVKAFLESKEKSYSRTKLLLGDLFEGGVGFAEAEKLKSIMDENRSIELNLSANYLSLEQLEETESKLKKDKTNIDQTFAQQIAEKRVQFEKLNNQLMQLLSKNSLKCDELRRICEIIEHADKIKFRVSHFRHVCDIRDSFRWVHLLDQFLDLPETSQDIFRKMSERLDFFDTSKHLEFDVLKSKLSRFVDAIEKQGDLNFFKTILDPVKDIESTDPSIQGLIDFIKTSRWTIIAKHRLHTKSMMVEELEDLYKNAPPNKKDSHDPIYHKVKELYNQMRLADNQLVILLKDMRDFLVNLDEIKISQPDSVEKIEAYNKKFTELTDIYENKLECIESLKNTDRYNNCLGLLTAINCALSIAQRRLIKRDVLDKVELLMWTIDEATLKSHPLLIRVLSSLNDKKIIQEFLSILEQHTLSSSLDDKIDINTAQKYIEIMKSDKNPIDYSEENEMMDKLVHRFKVWEEAALDFVRKYEVNSIETDYSLFRSTEFDSFTSQYQELMEELKSLHFYSDMVTAVLAVHFCVQTLDFTYGAGRKRADWEQLLVEGEDLAEIVPDFNARVQGELEKAKELIELSVECLKERACAKSIKSLREQLPKCAINLEEEMPGISERLVAEADLSEKIENVLGGDHKLKLIDLERINDEIKSSPIDFGETGRTLENTLQICKAFISAIKEMKKLPKDIKRAKLIYSTLPLFSPNFEAILAQMEEEEAILDELNDMLAKNTDFNDFDRISQMEANVAQIKYYNVERPRTGLFKQKVNLLVRISKMPDSQLSLPYMIVKSMRLECNELIKKYDNDDELHLLNDFLNDVDNEAKSYLASLANVKNPATLDKIKKTIMNFVDISGELIELQARVRLKSGGLRMDAGPLSTSFAPQSILKTQATGVLPKPPTLPLTRPPAGLVPIRTVTFDPSNPTIVRRADEENGDGIHGPPVPSYMATLGMRANGDGKPSLDLHATRSSMLSSLRVELQKNTSVGETEAECANIAQTIERTIFLRTNPEGTYSLKMSKVLKLFQNISKLKRISLLIVAKNYSVDLILFLMEFPINVLQDMDNDKDKLLKNLNLNISQVQADPNHKSVLDQTDHFTYIPSHNNGTVASKLLITPPSVISQLPTLRKRQPDTQEQSSQSLKPMLSAQKSLFQASTTPTLSNTTGAITNNIHPGVLNEEFEDELNTARQTHEPTSLDPYKIAKLKAKPSEDADRANNKFSELSGKTGDKSGDNLARGLQRGGNEKRGEIDIISEDSQREEKDGYRIKRKKSADKNQSVPAAIPSRVALYSDHTSDQNPWSVYKGTLKFEPRNPGFPPLNVDYCDLITVELKSKVSTFPKLPDKIEFKGAIEQAEFASTIDKMIKKPGKNFSYLLGFLKSNENTDSLFKLVTKTNSAFCCKYNPYTKLFLFNKTAFNKSWHEPMEVCSQKIYHALSNFMWLIVINLQTIEKDHPTITTIDPHAIYSQNLFEGFIPQESKLVI